jgi:LacI family transcriptional regulator
MRAAPDPLRVTGTHCISIGATNFTGAVTATEHLLSLGHRRIGHAGGPASVECSEARLSGYASALRREGLPLEESLVSHVPFDYEAGLRAGRDLLDLADPPTAVFAASDEIALGVIEEARRRGIRVPQDLSVVGFDNTFLAARAAPPLTTVAQPLIEMGQLAVRSSRTTGSARATSSWPPGWSSGGPLLGSTPTADAEPRMVRVSPGTTCRARCR